MSVETADLQQYVNKKVVLVRNLADSAEELEGTVVAAAGDALMFKHKGKTSALLINVSEIESITFAKERAKTLSRKTLKPVTHGQARTHLLERHAYALAAINAMSETEAFELHNGIDHEADDLGHVHGEKGEAATSDEE